MRNIIRLWLCFMMITLFLTFCSSIPKKEIHEAERAIKESEKINAAHYAPGELDNAKQYLDEAQKQVVDGNNDKAKEKAIVSKEMGWKAYFKSVDEFARDENASTMKLMEQAKNNHADKLVPDKFEQAQKLFEEVQNEIKEMEKLAEELKKQDEE